jgi:hypothetical protein
LFAIIIRWLKEKQEEQNEHNEEVQEDIKHAQ